MRDTSPEAEERYFQLLRMQRPEARLTTAERLSSAIRQLAEADIRARQPQATTEQMRVELAARLYGPQTAARLFPGIQAAGKDAR